MNFSNIVNNFKLRIRIYLLNFSNKNRVYSKKTNKLNLCNYKLNIKIMNVNKSKKNSKVLSLNFKNSNSYSTLRLVQNNYKIQSTI